MTPLPACTFALPQYSVLLARGADARTYLQGQLSCDMDALTRERMVLGSANSAQGRVQAVLWLVERSDAVALIVGSELANETLARLKKYVMRAKVQFTAAGELGCFGVDDDVTVNSLGLRPREHRETDGISVIGWPGTPSRVLVLSPPQPVTGDVEGANRWHARDIASGLPQIYPQTHESFVAQMLNLDGLGGIDFEKGCYTGQEIIARAHFRGTVKRRMYRYEVASATPIAPGTRVLANGQHAGDVVDSAATANTVELLVVVSLEQKDNPLTLESLPDRPLILHST